jgi:hypothetical protein
MCSFECGKAIERKRGLLECYNCKQTVAGCLSCVESNDVCLKCKPIVAKALKASDIWQLVAQVNESGVAFSCTNWTEREPELWGEIGSHINVSEHEVELAMQGSHTFDDDEHDLREAQIDHFLEISFKSSETQELQKKLEHWAEHAHFDYEDLWINLTYKPTSTTRGRWSGIYTVVVYMVKGLSLIHI